MKSLRHFLTIVLLLATALTATPASIASASAHTQPDAPASDLLMQFSSDGHILGFRADEFYLTNATYALRVQFVGANPVLPQSATPTAPAERGTSPLPRVTYANLWDGITLTYEPVSGGLMRSSYRLEPGADVRAIHLRYNIPVTRNADGTLTLTFATGQMTESAPTAWQESDGQRVPVPIGFHLFDSTFPFREVGFRVGAYDPTRPLFIDPTLSWNTFLGSSSDDRSRSIAVDGSGNVYVTGVSDATWQDGSTDPKRPYTGGVDTFVAKLDASGNPIWNTFLGGSSYDPGLGIVVDGSGNIYVTGVSAAPRRGALPGPMPGGKPSQKVAACVQRSRIANSLHNCM